MSKTHNIICEIAINVQNGFLNGSGIGNKKTSTAVKSFLHPEHGRLPYVSAQALRKWIRNSFINNLPKNEIPGYYDRVLDNFKKIKEKTKIKSVDPIQVIEDDVFGYTHPRLQHKTIIKQNINQQRAEVTSVNRHSPLKTSILYPIPETAAIITDSGFVHLPDDSPLPYENEFVNTYYTYTTTLELHRIGVFENIADILELDPELIDIYTKKSMIIEIPTQEKNAKRYQLSKSTLLERRLHVAKTYLKTLLTLTGGAKEAQFLADLTPKIIILALQKSANPRFMDSIHYNNEKLFLDPQEILEIIRHGEEDKDFLSDIYIGIRTGTLLNEQDIQELFKRREQQVKTKIHVLSVGKAISKFLNELREYYMKGKEEGKE